MQRPRFTFLAVPAGRDGDAEKRALLITWVLASSNSRMLARANRSFETYTACHDELLRLRANLDQVSVMCRSQAGFPPPLAQAGLGCVMCRSRWRATPAALSWPAMVGDEWSRNTATAWSSPR